MGNTVKEGICNNITARPSNKFKRNAHLNKHFLNDKLSSLETAELLEIAKLFESTELKQARAQFPILPKSKIAKKTCLIQRSNVSKKITAKNLYNACEVFIINELRNETSRFNSINIFSSLFSSIHSIFNDFCDKVQERKICDIKASFCVILDDQVNSNYNLNIYGKTVNRSLRHDLIYDFNSKVKLSNSANLSKLSINNSREDQNDNYSNERNVKVTNFEPFLSHVKLISKTESFKYKQIEHRESLFSKITPSSINSDSHIHPKLFVKKTTSLSAIGCQTANTGNLSSNYQNQSSQASSKHLINDNNKPTHPELSLIKETKEVAKYMQARIKKLQKISKVLVEPRQKVHKSSSKSGQSSGTKVATSKLQVSKKLKYTIILELREFAISSASELEYAGKTLKKINSYKVQNDLIPKMHLHSPKQHKYASKPSTQEKEFSMQCAKIVEQKCFDNSSLCQPIEHIQDRSQALRMRLAILEQLKKDNNFLFV